jgi:hypothetical protein
MAKNRTNTDVLTILESNIAEAISWCFKGLGYVLEIQYPKKLSMENCYTSSLNLWQIEPFEWHTIGRNTNRKRIRPGSGIEYHAIFSGNGGDKTWNRRTHQDNRLSRWLDNTHHSQTRTSKRRRTTKNYGQNCQTPAFSHHVQPQNTAIASRQTKTYGLKERKSNKWEKINVGINLWF